MLKIRLADISTIVIVSALMPFFRVTPLGSDVQPYFLALAAVWILPSVLMDIPKRTAVIAVALGAVLSIWCFAAGGYAEAVSMGILPVAIYWFAVQPAHTTARAVKIAVVVYLIGCLTQIVLGKAALEPIVSNLRISVERGLTSFASEPSYLGLVGLTLATTAMYYRMGLHWVILACLLTLLSMSGAAILPLVIILTIYAASTGNWRLIVVGGVAAVIVGSVLFTADDRFVVLAQNFWRDPSYIFQDESGANRLIRTFGPLQAAWRDYLLPHRFPDAGQISADFSFLTDRAIFSLDRLSNIASILTFVFGIFGIALMAWAFFYARTRAYVYAAAVCLLLINISAAAPYPLIIFAAMFRERIIGRRRGERQYFVRSEGSGGNPRSEPQWLIQPKSR